MAQKQYLDLAGLQSVIDTLYARGFKGMGLSHEDFTTELKTKYDKLVAGGASQADLTALTTRVQSLESLIEADSNAAIDKFNEIVAFLAGIENTDTLEGLLGDISTSASGAKTAADAAQATANEAKSAAEANATAIAGKADKATTLAGYGIADAKIGADNTITLGSKSVKPLTEHQSLADYAKTADVNAGLAGKVDKVTGKGLSSNDYTADDKAAVATISGKVNDADLVAITTEEIISIINA